MKFLSSIFICLLLLWGSRCPAQTPPPNDYFTNRTVLTGEDVSFDATTVGATFEFYDYPELAGGSIVRGGFGPTAWWTWTASHDGTVTIQISNLKGASGNAGLVFYIAPTNIYAAQPEPVAGSRFDLNCPFELFNFPAIAGTNYQIELTGEQSVSCQVHLIATNFPVIAEQPQTQTISIGDSVLFTVVASSALPFTYQWQYNGTDLPDETAPMLALDNVTTNLGGGYRVLIANTTGTNVSATANLFVTETDSHPLLTFVRANTNQLEFSLQGEVGRRYRIESSTNLIDWSAEMTFPSTVYYGSPKSVVFNSTGADRFAVPREESKKFYRAKTFHAALELCNNNMKQIFFAQRLFNFKRIVEDKDATVTVQDLRPYLKNQQFPGCPVGGPDAYLVETVLSDPLCNTGLHPFEER